MNTGYIYCTSNPSMEGLYKVEISEKNPKEYLELANSLDSWKPPTSYKIEMVKKVTNPKTKISSIYKLLEQSGERINPSKDFFKVKIEVLTSIFELIDEEVIQNLEDDDKDQKGCRDMSKCFTDKQKIRHTTGDNTWIGYYNYEKDVIIYDDKSFTSMSAFAQEHYRKVRPDRTHKANGWKECEYEIDGEWISTYEIII
jgi:hypothetical protein